MAKITRRRKVQPAVDKNKAKYERVAEIKSIIKSLDDESKCIQKELLDLPLVKEKIKTQYGTLSLRSRAKYETTDTKVIIDHMGQKSYNEKSTVSKTGVIESIGEQGFEDILTDGGMELGKTSYYYQLGK